MNGIDSGHCLFRAEYTFCCEAELFSNCAVILLKTS